jgi:hypothetical protein
LVILPFHPLVTLLIVVIHSLLFDLLLVMVARRYKKAAEQGLSQAESGLDKIYQERHRQKREQENQHDAGTII